MAASNRVKTIASTAHSKLSGHSKLNQKRATKVFPASRQHEVQTTNPSLFTTIWNLSYMWSSAYLLEYTMAANYTLIEQDGVL